MTITIPKLNSRYIPVRGSGWGGQFKHKQIQNWWSKESFFIYPNGLFNLIEYDTQEMEELMKNVADDMFILCDSGGFQIITGRCNLDWKGSLEKQIQLKATKIFALDTPPLKPKFKGSLNQFDYMSDEETKVIVEKNIDIAIQQSLFLQENYPEERKKFCYVLHGKTLEQIKFNLELIDKKIGVGKYDEYFPGGIVYAPKESDLLAITIAARHAYEHFIKRGVYVHFLGMGSFNRMIVLIRNSISTFDSSTILQGLRANEFVNPVHNDETLTLFSENTGGFTKKFCICPVCINIDYHSFKEEDKTDIARFSTIHNLWQILVMNVFLDALPKNEYTKKIIEYFKVNDAIKTCLDFCDECDKSGMDIAYSKYKHYLKKDTTKQTGLF
jgi:queuine/archaeosine tRNA-ribosyltransferase